MNNSASFAPKMLHPEQVSEQKPDDKPWLRQKSEPAIWYMRFKRYLDLGPKRSLRKALADEPADEKATKGSKKTSEQKKLSDISIPGAWSRASKVWNWQERAAAYDLAEQALNAGYIRQTAAKSRFASKAYRIIMLDWLARTLKEQLLEHGTRVDGHATIARLQSVMRDIAKEMEGLDEATLEMCDAAALEAIKQELTEGKQKK